MREERAAGLAGLAADLAAAGLPLLAIVSPSDGLAPPWQADPAALGARWPGLTRRYLTRANGASREYGHLDLVLCPEAAAEVAEYALDWLGEVISEDRRARRP
jgi:hypothetical protein